MWEWLKNKFDSYIKRKLSVLRDILCCSHRIAVFFLLCYRGNLIFLCNFVVDY